MPRSSPASRSSACFESRGDGAALVLADWMESRGLDPSPLRAIRWQTFVCRYRGGRIVTTVLVPHRQRAVEVELVWIEPGVFTMGNGNFTNDGFAAESPPHEVTLTRGFWMDRFPCTQQLWEAVMGDNPSEFRGLRRPVDNVSWDRARDFVTALRERVPGLPADLPTEAQWEYACRAGTAGPNYDPSGDLNPIAWNTANAGSTSHPVGLKRANAFGLHDMLGNVMEWCADGLRDYKPDPVVDPITPGRLYCYRGGCWMDDDRYCRADYRNASRPDWASNVHGLRLIAQRDEYA